MLIVISAIHLLVCILLILLILLQAGKGADLGAMLGGSAGSQTLFGSGGSSSFMAKMTTALAILFMITCLVLAYNSTREHREKSLMEGAAPTASDEEVAAPAAEQEEQKLPAPEEAGAPAAEDAQSAPEAAAEPASSNEPAPETGEVTGAPEAAAEPAEEVPSAAPPVENPPAAE